MSQTAVIEPPHLQFRAGLQENVVRRAIATGSWKFNTREENVTGLAWMVAITGCFLLVGLAGILFLEKPLVITLSGRAGLGASDAESTELTMAELQAMEEVREVEPVEQQQEMTLEDIPQPIDIPLDIADLPELAEALVTEDVFTVPAAPKIEEIIKPIDPTEPKPKPKPKQVAQTQPKLKANRATSTAATMAGGSVGSGGGSGGNGAVGSGSGKGRFPKPNYPSTARARGVSGQVTLALSINPAGQVESASAVSSRGGFNAEEQDAVAGFVQRNWKFPAGSYRRHTVNIVFNLSSR